MPRKPKAEHPPMRPDARREHMKGEFKSHRPAGEQERITEARQRAMELRRDGWSFREIAFILGVTVSTAYAYVQAELSFLRRKTEEDTLAVRDIELQRLDRMYLNLQPGIEAGDPLAINAALRIADRRSALLGLDAPSKREKEVPVVSDEALSKMDDAQLRELTMQLAKKLLGQGTGPVVAEIGPGTLDADFEAEEVNVGEDTE